MRSQKSFNQYGYTLVEIMVALAIVGISVFVVLQLVGALEKDLLRQKSSTARQRIGENLARIVTMPASLRASLIDMADNAELSKCVEGSSNQCINGDDFKGFYVTLPIVDVISPTDVMTSSPLTGPPDSPMRYDYDGALCDPNLNNCPAEKWPIEAVTEFSPLCPSVFSVTSPPYYGPIYKDGLDPLPTCDRAAYLKIRLTIRPSKDSSGSALESFSPIVSVIKVDVKSIVKVP